MTANYEAYEGGYEFGYNIGFEDAKKERALININTLNDSIQIWLDYLRRDGINVLESFSCRWDAAEHRLIVEQGDANG